MPGMKSPAALEERRVNEVDEQTGEASAQAVAFAWNDADVPGCWRKGLPAVFPRQRSGSGRF